MFRASADTGEGRRHARIRKIQLGLSNGGVGLLNRRFRELSRRGRIVVFLAAYGAVLQQRLQPRLLAPRLVNLRGSLRELSPRLRQGYFIRRTINLEERRALFHGVALFVELLLKDSGNARAHLDLFRSFDLTHDVEPDRNLPSLHRKHIHWEGGGGGAAGGGAR